MATEAPVADQTAQGHLEDPTLTSDIKSVDKENSAESTDLGGKAEEAIKSVENSAATESSVVSVEKQEDMKSELGPQEAMKKEGDELVAAGATEGNSNSSTAALKEEASSSIAAMPATVDPIAEAEAEKGLNTQPEPADADVVVADSAAAAKPALEADEKASVDASTQVSQATEVREAEPEKQAVPEAAITKVADSAEAVDHTATEKAAEEVNTTKEFPQVPSASVTEAKEAEAPIVSAVPELAPSDITAGGVTETTGTSQGDSVSAKLEEKTEPPEEAAAVADSGKVSDIIEEAVVSKAVDEGSSVTAPVQEKEEGEGSTITEEVVDAPKPAEGNLDASAPTFTSLVAGSLDAIWKSSEDKNEKEEKSAGDLTKTDSVTQVAEVPSEGEKTSEVVEEKDGNLEGENTHLVETSRDVDIGNAETNATEQTDNLVSEKSDKDDEQTQVESAKDVDEARKEEIPAKSSERQSHNIFSKMKNSISKVKKAMTRKSPNSKTMSAEGKDEIKVK